MAEAKHNLIIFPKKGSCFLSGKSFCYISGGYRARTGDLYAASVTL